jgi:hypothetical protein
MYVSTGSKAGLYIIHEFIFKSYLNANESAVSLLEEFRTTNLFLAFLFVLAFGSRDSQDISVYGRLRNYILMQEYFLYNLIFSVPIRKA